MSTSKAWYRSFRGTLGCCILSLGVGLAAAPPAAAQAAEPVKNPSVDPTPEDFEGNKPLPAPETTEPEPAPVVADPKPEQEEEHFGHGMQVGVKAALLGGYRMVFRYDQSPRCTDPSTDEDEAQKFCGFSSPLALDLGLSFAPLDGIEPFIWGRFGLKSEAETDTKPLLVIGAGARLYTMSDSKFKVFIQPAIGLEFEGGVESPAYVRAGGEYKTDVVFHLTAGPQYDFARYAGVFLGGGITTGVLRSIHTTLEVSGGLQLRVP